MRGRLKSIGGKEPFYSEVMARRNANIPANGEESIMAVPPETTWLGRRRPQMKCGVWLEVSGLRMRILAGE